MTRNTIEGSGHGNLKRIRISHHVAHILRQGVPQSRHCADDHAIEHMPKRLRDPRGTSGAHLKELFHQGHAKQSRKQPVGNGAIAKRPNKQPVRPNLHIIDRNGDHHAQKQRGNNHPHRRTVQLSKQNHDDGQNNRGGNGRQKFQYNHRLIRSVLFATRGAIDHLRGNHTIQTRQGFLLKSILHYLTCGFIIRQVPSFSRSRNRIPEVKQCTTAMTRWCMPIMECVT